VVVHYQDVEGKIRLLLQHALHRIRHGQDLHEFALESVWQQLGWVLTYAEIAEMLGAGRASG
jgi:hypothetical protein